MKNLIFAIALIIATPIYSFSQEKSSKSTKASIKVEGVCSACKKRIENAAYLPGVKHAEWNKDTNTLDIVYNSAKVSQQAIEKEIAAKGHTTENVKANRETYENLPACCAYETNHKH